jgi:hypothetical protein
VAASHHHLGYKVYNGSSWLLGFQLSKQVALVVSCQTALLSGHESKHTAVTQKVHIYNFA